MKKRTLAASAAAVFSAVAVAGAAAYAAPKYTADDLIRLSSSLLGESELLEGQDVNNDGRVDVFDLVEMRKTFSHSGEFSECSVVASQENVRYIGRNIYLDDIAWLVQSGSSIEFTVTGRSAEVTICGDKNTATDEKYQPRYAVIVDGEVIADALISKNETIVLFDGEQSRTATVQVIHLSEANNGAVGVSGIKVDSDVPKPVVPTAKKPLQIEFIGDSITCAYGVEGKDQYEGFSTATENFMLSYAYLAAKQLDADYSAVSYSGHGIISGYSANGEKMTDSLVPEVYDYVGKLEGYRIPWDFENNKKDVIVINLGTNDDSYASKDLEVRGEEYAEEYAKFLSQVHERNPDSYIICTLGTMGCTELYPYIEKAVDTFKAESGYDRIMSYMSATQSMDDGLGSDWHPSAITQQNSAYVLADKICQALGIESDQIGIDIAAEAEFNSVQSDSAMMSAYFSDWDRSYHVTTVTGGESKESIQIFAGDLNVRENGVYKLKFRLDISPEAEIPFCIRDKSDGSVLFEDSVKGAELIYEKEFTCPESGNAELVFSMGGTDSLRVSVHDLKLIKVG